MSRTPRFSMLIFVLVSGYQSYGQSPLARGIQLFNDKNYPMSKTVLEAALDESAGDPEANFYLGLIAMRVDHDYDKAADYLETAVKSDPSKAEYHFQYGNALGAKAQRSNVLSQMVLAPKIKSEFEKTVEKDPSHTGGRFGLMQYYLMAPGIAGGSVDKAKEQAALITKLDAYLGCTAFIRIFEHEKDNAQVETYCKKGIALNPQKSELYNRLGYLYLQQNRNDDAIAQFQKMAEVDPGNANSFDSLGDGFLAKNQIESALESYKKAVVIDPKFSASVFNVASCYHKLNQPDKAKEYFQQFLLLVPKGEKADEARAQLKSLN